MKTLSERLKDLEKFIGNTPMLKLESSNISLFAKLEYLNFSGSSKDRASFNILLNAILEGKINEETTIIESSSGNMALSLAKLCDILGLKFIAVIDSNINHDNEEKLRSLAYKIIKVTERDSSGGYLLNRIKAISDYLTVCENIFWTNQYENPNNYEGYYKLASEIADQLDHIDYLFLAVSSGGTITGLSRKLKERYPNLKIIAVDVEGSLIFSTNSKRRNISGIGCSKVPPLIQYAKIDDFRIISEVNIVEGANLLFTEQNIYAGASSGAIYFAIKDYFKELSVKQDSKPVVLFICPDHGNSYHDTIFNIEWSHKLQK